MKIYIGYYVDYSGIDIIKIHEDLDVVEMSLWDYDCGELDNYWIETWEDGIRIDMDRYELSEMI